MPLTMQPLSDKFGVAITGVDLSTELDEKLFNEIVDVFVKSRSWFFAISISSLNIKLPSAAGLAPVLRDHSPSLALFFFSLTSASLFASSFHTSSASIRIRSNSS